eukprot:UN08992
MKRLSNFLHEQIYWICCFCIQKLSFFNHRLR